MRKREEIQRAFADRSDLEGRTKFFLVGIGGAGMSALARMLKARGYTVTGTDSAQSPEVERLWSEGFEVHVGHAGEPLIALHASSSDVAVVLTDAIDLERSPEVAAARALDLPLFRRSQALGWLLRGYRVIAVTGTHGKTTTTGMTGAGLIAAGVDPLVVVGAGIADWGGPVREGSGRYAVVEACEAYDAFHDLDPYLVILTNLELDHVDFHGNYENLRSSVLRFVNRIPEAGALIYCADDAGAREIAELAEVKTVTGYGTSETWRRQAANTPDRVGSEGIELTVPGPHNRLNASGALTAAAFLKQTEPVELDMVAAGIAGFTGAERRLQTIYRDEITVVDDYAHHPTEIEASLNALRERQFGMDKRMAGRLIVVYQPHLYSRTAPLIAEFAKALSVADYVVLTDIYPAREDPMPGVSSARIAELISKPVLYVPSRHLLPMEVARIVQPGDTVVGMGAGTIGEFAGKFVAEWQRQRRDRIKVVVLYGGDSAEREVSLHSGRAVFAALQKVGYDVSLLDPTEQVLGKGDLSPFLGPKRPDVAFLAVHGTHSEDGALQGLLELLQIPYTGSGIQASALAMDKDMTKRVLSSAGIRVPVGKLVRSLDDLDGVPSGPVVVKPNAQGSTVGLRFVEAGQSLCEATAYALQYDDSVLVEEWVKGMEISVPVLNGKALPPVEIAPASGRYDFASKYLPGATEEIVPARLPDAVIARVQQIAVQAHTTLGCQGATRTDMLIRPSETPDAMPEIFVLEVNTLPGMTATSLLPNSARAAGIPFEELCRQIVEDALRRHAPTS